MGKITDAAVRQLRLYAHYLDENADALIGSVDAPAYVTTDGIRISFVLCQVDEVPTIEVSKTHIVLDALAVEP